MSRGARPWVFCTHCNCPLYQINVPHTCGVPERCLQCGEVMFAGHDCFARPTLDFQPVRN